MTKRSRKRQRARKMDLAQRATTFNYDAEQDVLCVSPSESTTRTTPLMRALMYKNIQNLLGPDGKLKNTALVNARAANGWTALHIVACNLRQYGLGKYLKVLLESDADVNAVDHAMRTALHHVFRWYDSNMSVLDHVIELIAHGADVNKADQNGSTALMLALKFTHDHELGNIVHALVRAGAQVNAVDSSGNTPLEYLFKNQTGCTSIEPLNVLVSAGLNVNAADMKGVTPLIRAAQINSRPWVVEAIQALVDAGANANAADADTKTALVYAIFNHNEHTADIVRVLLKAGANTGTLTGYSVSIFDYVQSQRGCTNTIVEFVIGGAVDSIYDVHTRQRQNSVWKKLVGIAYAHRNMIREFERASLELAVSEADPLPGEDFLRALLVNHTGILTGAEIRAIAKAYVDVNIVPCLKSPAGGAAGTEGTGGQVFNITQSSAVDTDAIIELAFAPDDLNLSLSSWEKNAVFKSLAEIAREHRKMRPVFENTIRALAAAKTSSLPGRDFMSALLDKFTADGVSVEADIPVIAAAYVDAILAPRLKKLMCDRAEMAAGCKPAGAENAGVPTISN